MSLLNAHLNATRARLESHPMLTGKVDDVARLTSSGDAVRTNYLILSVDLPDYVDERLAGVPGPAGDTSLSLHVRVVAVDVAGLNLLTDAVTAQLQGHKLGVPGRDITPLTRDLESPEFDRVSRLFSRDAWFEATSSRT